MHRSSSLARTVVSVSAFVHSAQALIASPPAIVQSRFRSFSALSRTSRRNLSSAAAKMMTPTEKYLFDLNGFIVVRNVLTPEEVAAANAAVDAHQVLSPCKPATLWRGNDIVCGTFRKSSTCGRTTLWNTAKGTPFSGDGKTPRCAPPWLSWDGHGRDAGMAGGAKGGVPETVGSSEAGQSPVLPSPSPPSLHTLSLA
eukprot:3462037-Rhodomonas_salina.1